ncbi:DUF3224 domain-containing protein [Streptosporangium sp. NPDC051023]|uniref:DUF3224 domain-containing protein n=1 Tax=Streptosporangium sp. NPDC051023 TaxID=3155410 RepID=UPI00344C7F97
MRLTRLRFPVVAVLAVAVAMVSTSAAAGPVPAVRVAEGTFKVVRFTNEPYKQLPGGASLSRFSALDAFEGDIQGEGEAEAEMFNRADGTTRDVGYIVITGTLGGRSGSFVVETTGTFDGKSVASEWKVVPGTGTGELRGLQGQGVETAALTDDGWLAHYRLTYHFR